MAPRPRRPPRSVEKLESFRGNSHPGSPHARCGALIIRDAHPHNSAVVRPPTTVSSPTLGAPLFFVRLLCLHTIAWPISDRVTLGPWKSVRSRKSYGRRTLCETVQYREGLDKFGKSWVERSRYTRFSFLKLRSILSEAFNRRKTSVRYQKRLLPPLALFKRLSEKRSSEKDITSSLSETAVVLPRRASKRETRPAPYPTSERRNTRQTLLAAVCVCVCRSYVQSNYLPSSPKDAFEKEAKSRDLPVAGRL
jgi:hypothetical protein